MNDQFEYLVLEKLGAIEQRISGMERQINLLVDAFSHHGERLTHIETTCVKNHAGTPPPVSYDGGNSP